MQTAHRIITVQAQIEQKKEKYTKYKKFGKKDQDFKTQILVTSKKMISNPRREALSTKTGNSTRSISKI